MSLYKINHPIVANIIYRPSKIVKSPYVADIKIEGDEDQKYYLAHTAALGCCGLSESGCSVIVEKIENQDVDSENTKCKYRILLSLVNKNIIVGIYPKLAEKLVENALLQNRLTILKNVKKYKRECTISIENMVNSKFDFAGIDENGIPFLLEVKNVPLADYEDYPLKEKKRRYKSLKTCNKVCKCCKCGDMNSKVAYFPDGYRKSINDTVSPRALKHIKELTYIKNTSITRCIMCYVIQRNDVNCFQPSIVDPEYRAAFREAIKSGVEIITFVVKWSLDGEATFITDNLPLGDYMS
jgi:DNA-binding sugar fermentation-stimulating protein